MKEWIINSDKEFFKKNKEKKEFFKDVVEYLYDRWGRKNVEYEKVNLEEKKKNMKLGIVNM